MGKALPIGTVRQRKDGKYIKTEDGWEPYEAPADVGHATLREVIDNPGCAYREGYQELIDLGLARSTKDGRVFATLRGRRIAQE
jgi:hypothetical protein